MSFCPSAAVLLRVVVAPNAKIIKMCHYEPIWTLQIEPHLEMKWRNRNSYISPALKLQPHCEVDIIRKVAGTNTLSPSQTHRQTQSQTNTHQMHEFNQQTRPASGKSMSNVHAQANCTSMLCSHPHTLKHSKHTPSQPGRCSASACTLAEP